MDTNAQKLKNVKTDKVVSGLFWVYLENISAQIVSFIVSIILARLLAPSYYGTIALVVVFISVANVFVNSGFGAALIQKKDSDELDYNSMFWFNFIVSLFLYIIIFVLSPFVAQYYRNTELSVIMQILALSVPLSAFNCIQQAYVSSNMAFKKSFLSKFGGALVSGIAAVCLAYGGAGIWALVVQRILQVFLDTFLLWLIVRWTPRMIFSWQRLKPLISYGWKLLTTGMLFTVYSELRTLIIGKRYSTEDLGFYNQGFSFPKFIANNVDSTITRVLFPTLSNVDVDSVRLTEMTRRAAKTSVFIMTPILFGLMMVSDTLVPLLIGEKWVPCIPYMKIMCLVWWLQPTQTCSLQAIKAIGRSDIYLKAEIFNKIIGLGMLAYAVFVVDSVMAIALTMLAAQFVAMLVYGLCSQKYIGYKIHDQFTDIIAPLLYSLPMCFFVWIMPLLIRNPFLCITLQVIVGGLLFMAMSILCKSESLRYITNILGVNISFTQRT